KNFLKKRKITDLHVCLEATGHYSDAIAQFLHDLGYTVSVVNPSRIKSYADSLLSRNKTDAGDALIIAGFCRTQKPDTWSPPALEIVELQAMVRQLGNLKEMRQQERNRLEAGISSKTVLDTLEKHIAFIDKQIKDLEKRIHDHINRHPGLKQQHDLLTSIPGIGDVSAFKLLAEIRDISAFDSASQLAAFAGLTPRQRVSGSSVRSKSRLSKRGSPRLRECLFMPAIVAKKHNPILSIFAQRLEKAGKSKMVIIGALMRKLLHLAYGVLKSGQPFDLHYLEKSQIPS
ncbi:MAG TPA: IS110 family transposase, partial [Aggregatilineales bacterium]|nr:IS110 family transposase [Aggregatilineales bacterium]